VRRRRLAAPLVLAAAAAAAGRAAASESAGYVNLGFYSAKEQLATASADVTSNDYETALGRAYLDVTKIGPYSNEVTFDLRDKYDAYGGVDAYNSRLVAADQPELRQLALKYPYEDGSLYWALGRFPVADAEVLGNDGADLGVRFGRVKVGAFGGLLPEQRYGRTVQLQKEDHQAGLYAIYQDKGQDKVQDWTRSTYASTAFVLRQPVQADDRQVPTGAAAGTIAGDQPSPPPGQPETASTTSGVTPVTAAEPPLLKNYVFWYANVQHQPSDRTRLSLVSHVDLQPAGTLRNLWASVSHAATPRLSGTVSALHLDLTEYERQRDLRDTLPASVYNEGRFDARFKLNRYYLVDGDAIAGSRSLDGKQKAAVDGRFVASSLAHGHLQAFAGGGYRTEFIMKDTILKVGATLYARRLELGVTQQFIVENRDSGEVYHPLVSDLSLGFVLANSVLASGDVEYAKDERATIVSGLVTLGYRFGGKQQTPVRSEAPRVERL
jgi:hypothetical protein